MKAGVPSLLVGVQRFAVCTAEACIRSEWPAEKMNRNMLSKLCRLDLISRLTCIVGNKGAAKLPWS